MQPMRGFAGVFARRQTSFGIIGRHRGNCSTQLLGEYSLTTHEHVNCNFNLISQIFHLLNYFTNVHMHNTHVHIAQFMNHIYQKCTCTNMFVTSITTIHTTHNITFTDEMLRKSCFRTICFQLPFLQSCINVLHIAIVCNYMTLFECCVVFEMHQLQMRLIVAAAS